MDVQRFKDRYASILNAFAESEDERYLAEAAELGRELVLGNVAPEDIAEIHEDGVKNLAKAFPNKTLLESASRIYAPLVEMLMAYGLAFREWFAELKAAEERLVKYQWQLRSLASELLLTEERERRHLAKGIHDQICQKLALAKVALQCLKESEFDSTAWERLDAICEEIDEVIEEAHSLVFGLASPVLYELGLNCAVEKWLSEQVEKKYGIECKFSSEIEASQLSDEVSGVLFADIRELLTNVIKHAKAKAVSVWIREADNMVRVTVEDDGVGFCPSEVSESLPRKGDRTDGFGLFAIRERLEYIGGGLEIESEPGKGCRVTVGVPAGEIKGHSC